MLTNMSVNPTIAVKDLNVARNFYVNKLGLRPVQEDSNQFVQFVQAGDTKIELYVSQFAGTNQATTLTFGVGNKMDEEVKELRNKGVEFEHYSMPDARLDGDIHVMKDMKAAWFKDPDGNIICLHDH